MQAKKTTYIRVPKLFANGSKVSLNIDLYGKQTFLILIYIYIMFRLSLNIESPAVLCPTYPMVIDLTACECFPQLQNIGH